MREPIRRPAIRRRSLAGPRSTRSQRIAETDFSPKRRSNDLWKSAQFTFLSSYSFWHKNSIRGRGLSDWTEEEPGVTRGNMVQIFVRQNLASANIKERSLHTDNLKYCFRYRECCLHDPWLYIAIDFYAQIFETDCFWLLRRFMSKRIMSGNIRGEKYMK